MLSEHDLLTPEECTRATDIIHSLKDHWVNRSGGLNYWDIGAEHKDLSKGDLESLRKDTEPHYFPYHLGKLVLHNGLTLHQIAPSKNMQDDDERITLQGHGLMCDGIMRLYW